MAPSFRFRLAQPSDGPALQTLLQTVPMPGPISLTMRRQPDFFQAEHIGNLDSQVIVCAADDGRIAGFGVRALRSAFVNRHPTTVAYISTLRSYPWVRHGLLLARGYRFLRNLNEDGRAAWTYTTIYDDNAIAKEILTSGRAGLPRYTPLVGLRTYCLPLRRRSRRDNSAVTNAATLGTTCVVEALNCFNQSWQFAPHWSPEDLEGTNGRMLGFRPDNLLCIVRNNRPVATLGVWDQSDTRQHVVQQYHWSLNLYQPLSPLADRLGLGPVLPPLGRPLNLLYGCCLSGPLSETHTFERLLNTVIATWTGRGYDYLLIGLHCGHPYERFVARRSRMTLHSTTYVVEWQDGRESLPSISDALPHLEIATL